MEHPGRHFFVGIAIVASASLAVAAEAETKAAAGLSASRERVVSPRVAGILASAMPKYTPAVAAENASTPAEPAPAASARITASERPAPANGIVRLPEYVVRDRKPAKLPHPEEVMSRDQLERIAMQRHLGDEQGLERALSMITPVHLWRKIPVLGKFPLVTFETNEQRAMRMDREAKIKERWEALDGLMSPELRPGAAPVPPQK